MSKPQADETERIEARAQCYQQGMGDYDAAADFEASINACYAAIRERVAAGGKAWPR
jgi:hypothetical protein